MVTDSRLCKYQPYICTLLTVCCYCEYNRAWFEFAVIKKDGSLEHFGAELVEPSAAAMERQVSLLEKFRQSNEENKKLAKIEEEKRAEEQAKKDEEEKYLNTYVSSMKPLTAAKTKSNLSKYFEGLTKWHKFIEDAVKNGQTLLAKDVNGKMSYRLYQKDNTYYEINKTAYDYGTRGIRQRGKYHYNKKR